MRILSRPMFKYGGPIKEGVMHGMRNNYQSGQLVRPGPGRPGYQGEGFWQKLGAQYKPKNLFKWSRLNPFKKLKTLTKVPQIVKGIPKNLQGIFTQTGKTSGITGSPAATTFMQNLRSFPGASKIGGWATKARDLAVKYPKTTALTALYGGVPLAANLPYKKIASTIADVAIPDQIYNWETGRWFNSDDTDLKPSDKKIVEEKKAEVKETWTPSGTTSTTPILTESMREKVASAAKDRRLNNLLDIMGYDKSKKTAVYDALIDASQIVTQAPGGEQLDITKDIISPIIAATGKRLDKPEQIREAVGLLMAKGEIEKDVTASKGSQLKQQATDLVTAGVFKTEKAALEHLAKKPGFEDTVMAIYAKTGTVDSGLLSSALKSSGEGIPIRTYTSADKSWKEFKKNNKDNPDVEVLFIKDISDRKPGHYVVGDRVVKVNTDLTVEYKW